ncbi:MAG TPA: matrixin family metalloprotease, partial [Vicinamibacteria bacterium]
MRSRRVILIALLLGGCGRSGDVSRPTPLALTDLPAGTVLTVASGETGSAVRGVRLVIAGHEYRSDDDGRVRLDAVAAGGALMDVDSDGYLARQTLVRSASETRFTLWPRLSPTGLDEEFTRRLIYTSGADGALPGEQALERIVARSVALIPTGELRADAVAMANLAAGADRMTDLTEGKVRYQIADRAPDGAVPVELVVNAKEEYFATNIQAAAFAQLTLNSRSEITGARIAFRDMSLAQRQKVAHHELGHTLGLGHSPFTGDLMHCCSPQTDAMTPRERLAVQLAYQRRPGNRFPDNDRDSRSQSAGGSSTRVIVCDPR